MKFIYVFSDDGLKDQTSWPVPNDKGRLSELNVYSEKQENY
jgi:hypothetical protein